ncbi:anthranilate phosphoribosyltransferase, partial [bacterium]|nr:anthranilate phosphoribosyltransferase [bacterium]
MNTEIQQILKRLLSKEILDRQDAKRTLTLLVTEDNEYLKTAIVSAMTMRAPALTEIAGFRDAMLELSLPLDLKGLETADLCGTGGDGKNTFNISTLSALTAAAAGVRI